MCNRIVESLTIDVDDAGAIANQAVRGFLNIVQADYKANLVNHLDARVRKRIRPLAILNHLVTILCVDAVFECLDARQIKILRCDLNHVFDHCLNEVRC